MARSLVSAGGALPVALAGEPELVGAFCPFVEAERPELVPDFALGGGAEAESLDEMLLNMEEPVSVPSTEVNPDPGLDTGATITGGGGGALKSKLLPEVDAREAGGCGRTA
jgi:hypothetical protein